MAHSIDRRSPHVAATLSSCADLGISEAPGMKVAYYLQCLFIISVGRVTPEQIAHIHLS